MCPSVPVCCVPRPQAVTFAEELKFGGGREPLCSSNLDKLGVAIGLYFRLMKYLGVLFFVMSLVSIPILWACRVGSRVSPQDVDPFKLNIWSLGNVNVDTNTTFKGIGTYSSQKTALIISTCDTIYSGVFLLFIFFWKYKLHAVTKSMKDDFLRISDYAVRVHGLPPLPCSRDIPCVYMCMDRSW